MSATQNYGTGRRKTATARVFLRPGTGKISINDPGAEDYARSVKKQLEACKTVLDWVRVWNDTIGTYATHLFGPLSNIMGKEHLQAVKNTYNAMFDIILDSVSLRFEESVFVPQRYTTANNINGKRW